MKKLFWLLFFLSTSGFCQVYFIYPTVGERYTMNADGSKGINYKMDNEIDIYVSTWQISYQRPDGFYSGYYNTSQTGGWVFDEVGGYSTRGRAWGVVIDLPGGNFQWYYTYSIPFYIDPPTPPPPPLSVSISGPSTAPCANGTWTAAASGGYPPYSYQWYHEYTSSGPTTPSSAQSISTVRPMVPINTWIAIGTNSPTLSYYLCGGDGYLRVDVTDSHGTLVSAQYYVAGAGGIQP